MSMTLAKLITKRESDEEYEYQHLKSIEKILEDEEEEEFSFEINKYKLITKRIDANRIRHKTANNIEIYTSVTKNVKLSMESHVRSGAIIYTHFKGETYFCMGIDSSYGDLTDFAGGVKKTDESVLHGGLRELQEESLGIFGDLKVEDISESLAFYCSNMLIMFIRLNIDIEKTKEDFKIQVKNKSQNNVVGEFTSLEVSEIYWLKKEEFLDSILGKGKRMYSRVRKILSKVTEIISVL